MANTSSALKRMRQSEKRRLHNSAVRSRVKAAAKMARMALGGEPGDAPRDAVKRAATIVDRAVSKGVIHRNTAARMKSRLAQKLNKLSAQPASS